MEENLYEKLIKYNKPSQLIRKFFNMKLDEKLSGKKALDLGAGVRK